MTHRERLAQTIDRPTSPPPAAPHPGPGPTLIPRPLARAFAPALLQHAFCQSDPGTRALGLTPRVWALQRARPASKPMPPSAPQPVCLRASLPIAHPHLCRGRPLVWPRRPPAPAPRQAFYRARLRHRAAAGRRARPARRRPSSLGAPHTRAPLCPAPVAANPLDSNPRAGAHTAASARRHALPALPARPGAAPRPAPCGAPPGAGAGRRGMVAARPLVGCGRPQQAARKPA
jgi:hypothetical protein